MTVGNSQGQLPDVGPGYQATLQIMQQVLARIVVESGQPDPGLIPPEHRITDVAANSVQLLQVHAGLEEALGVEIAAGCTLRTRQSGRSRPAPQPRSLSPPSSCNRAGSPLRRDGVAVASDSGPVTVLVGCGTDVDDTETVIVDPDLGSPCPAGSVGEVWVTGPGVAAGYWNQPERTDETFRRGPAGDPRRFVRTGDLGVKIDGVLYLVGRVKDMIIQRGVNHCPQDVEHAAENAHPALRLGGTVVFTTEPGDTGPVVVLCELERYPHESAYPAILSTVRTALAEEFGLDVATVGLVRKGQIPKTTSGKVRRRASAQRWQSDGFQLLARSSALSVAGG